MKLQGTCDGAKGSVDWRGAQVDAYQRTSLTGGWKLLEQGPESQAASWICCGGVAAVIGSSDLDELTFVSGHAQGNQP